MKRVQGLDRDGVTAQIDGSIDAGRGDDSPAPGERRPTLIGRYIVVGELGRGGMGIVYRAYDPRLHRDVALKCVNSPRLGLVEQAKLVAEARAMASLRHPNVVPVFDVESTEPMVVVVVEYVEGPTLAEWLAQRRRPWPEIVRIFVQAGRGLQAAHGASIVHRDFKPSNALVGRDGRVRVADFGLCRVDADDHTSADPRGEPDGPTDDGSAFVSDSTPMEPPRASGLDGTLAYMAPELVAGGRTFDASVDQYAWCVALWCGLFDAWPFPADDLHRRLELQRKGPPPSPRTEVPTAIVQALRRGLAPDPRDRWPSMAALLDRLERRLDRRRWGPWVAGGLLLVGTGAAGWQLHDAERPSCEASEGVHRFWTDDRRRELSARFETVELPYAELAGRHAIASLDRYAERWRVGYLSACRAAETATERDRLAIDLRIGCLRRAETELRTTIDALATADVGLVERAQSLTEGLPDLDRCDDAEGLATQTPPPADPLVAARVDAVRLKLAEVTALDRAGRYDAALAHVRALESDVADIDYEPLQAEYEAALGHTLELVGNPRPAEHHLRRAFALALRSRQWDLGMDAAQDLGFVVGDLLGRPREGLAWIGAVEGLTERPGVSATIAARLHRSRGSILSELGRYGEAEPSYRRALDLELQVLEPDSGGVAAARNSLGVALWRLGRYAEAEEELRRASTTFERVYGPDHPVVAIALNNLGNLAKDRGEFVAAEAAHRRALDIRTRTFGPHHTEVAVSANNLANTLRRVERYDEAEVLLRRAVDIFTQARGPEHPTVLSIRNNLANVLQDQGRAAEGEREHREILAIRERVLGPDHPDVAGSLVNIGMALREQGKPVEAEPLQRRALALRLAALPLSHPLIAVAQHELGRVLLAQGRADEAELWFRRALQSRQAEFGPDHPDVEESQRALAQAIAARRAP